ncbi:MAG: 2-succinyl-5-enolpyruvyl-6-hydroxy-3-cyclohexene-1-carboxylic-acid synthase [Planctomycetota bacterium]|nr:2-succinyl-5-enolpyruvyl-6-hydroxy-3-cyclohexene-1-carboxylic-acid synthase [Planctomycetota bacterium]
MSASPSKHFDPTDAPNINALWTQLAFAEWSRLGLSLAVVCPGSRSAPLAYAISRNPRIESIIAHDERSAGFVALGAARATGRAAVVVTTSGTAVANLLPAVVEASKTGTPMLLVTADRPPELHDCGANQSIHQSHIFGAFARWSIDVPCADEAIAPHWILSTADEAWRRAHSPSQSAGPVHLNWMFREPLAPSVIFLSGHAVKNLGDSQSTEECRGKKRSMD